MIPQMAIAEEQPRKYGVTMSTLAEIQEAITSLRDEEKAALSTWLQSQSAPAMSVENEQRLLCSIDEAIRDVDAGKGVPIEEARKLVASWAAK